MRNALIGLNDRRSEGRYEWYYPTKKPNKRYTDWCTGEPRNLNGDTDCVILQQYRSNYYWWGRPRPKTYTSCWKAVDCQGSTSWSFICGIPS